MDVWLNRKPVTLPLREYSGAELRQLFDVPAEFGLYRLTGAGDVLIEPDTRVSLAEDMAFYTSRPRVAA